ncbi:MAG: sodium:calcium antiporter [Candidatus Aenigmarchaeota archaeon]|nr:sodium:calcium antiporter [Candidatus Aenigmarchaeota archaeon]
MVLVEAMIFIAAMVVLIKASQVVIDSSIKISDYTGISQMAIGFILVAIAVSIPDFTVSVIASSEGRVPLAIGDVLGSSVANLCLVLGIATLMRKVTVGRKHTLDSSEVLLMISVIPAVILSRGLVGMFEGALLLLVFALYSFFVFKKRFRIRMKDGLNPREWKKAVALLVVALAAVIISSGFVVSSSAEIAMILGIPEAVIGMTLLAFGTTLPELAIDFTAIRKGNVALAVGDVLGSTVVNLTLILGAVLLISPSVVQFSIYTLPIAFIMVANAFLFYSMVKHGTIGQRHGLVFILLYILFLILIGTSTNIY